MVTRVDGSTPPGLKSPSVGEAAPAAAKAAASKAARVPKIIDSESFAPPAGTVAEMNPAVSVEMQHATYARIFALGKAIAEQGKIPVILIDHRLTGIDDRPLIIQGLKELAQRNNVPELLDPEAALKNRTLRSLPGYTAEACDDWRHNHPELVEKYPGVFGGPGSRIDRAFMSRPVRQANATAGLAQLEAAFKLATRTVLEDGAPVSSDDDGVVTDPAPSAARGKAGDAAGNRRVIEGKLVFAGSGGGLLEDFIDVYTRDVSEGGAGLVNPDVRKGAPAPTAEANARAAELVAAYNEGHPAEPEVRLDPDSAGKAGWVITIETEKGPNGEEYVIVAVIDDRAHNRLAMQGAAKLGTNTIAAKSVLPQLSYSQNDNGNPNQISNFYPNPR
jgi:hypothetical protein